MKTFCVIPAWNEEKNIFKTISSVLPRVDFIVVVDDYSKDNTCLEVEKMLSLPEAKDKLKLLRHPINLGQGAALQTGNEYAISHGADVIVHFDADGQFLSEELPVVIQAIVDGQADIVFGSRFLNIKSDIPKLKKNIIMPLAKIFNLVFFGIKTSDPQSGFRAMTKETAQKIKIENNMMAHCTEILAKAHKYKLRIKEVPITVIYNHFGQKFSGSFKIIKDLLFKKISS
jgi:glycosyltransferase involved in cell wall biosynthesis